MILMRITQLSMVGKGPAAGINKDDYSQMVNLWHDQKLNFDGWEFDEDLFVGLKFEIKVIKDIIWKLCLDS